ncbi:MAG: exonuclease subunit SbcD [Verrucomicrobiota bacterium]|jgi:exonuclease SbcD
MTRLIHTADWHLGARLIDCDRHEEHAAFLEWLLQQLAALRPDLLIVAGDIFDGATPPQEALKLYYHFLSRLAQVARCQTLVLGGNHDSPATLHAPREVLRALDVRVIAAPPENPADALISLPDAIICAVPYLRERDVRTASPGQSADEVAAAIRTGIKNHYRAVYELAQATAAGRLIIGTGHLTALGSAISPSERTIHIGNLGAVSGDCFDGFAYTALGHIHRPQPVGGNERVRYAGSPIALSFAEVDLAKEIRVIDINGPTLTHHAIPLPVFRSLIRLTTNGAALGADLATVLTHLRAGPNEPPLIPWLELTVTDGRSHPDLARRVSAAAAELPLRILKVMTPAALTLGDDSDLAAPTRALSDFRPEDVFTERLRCEQIPTDSAEAKTLSETFSELLSGLHESVDFTTPSQGAP